MACDDPPFDATWFITEAEYERYRDSADYRHAFDRRMEAAAREAGHPLRVVVRLERTVGVWGGAMPTTT